VTYRQTDGQTDHRWHSIYALASVARQKIGVAKLTTALWREKYRRPINVFLTACGDAYAIRRNNSEINMTAVRSVKKAGGHAGLMTGISWMSPEGEMEEEMGTEGRRMTMCESWSDVRSLACSPVFGTKQSNLLLEAMNSIRTALQLQRCTKKSH